MYRNHNRSTKNYKTQKKMDEETLLKKSTEGISDETKGSYDRALI